MIVGITVISCSILYSIMVAIVYFSKKKLNNTENKIYSFLMKINIFGLFIELLCCYFLFNKDISPAFNFLNKLFNKTFIIYLLTWEVTFTTYVFFISFNTKEKHKKILINNKKKIRNVIALLSIFLLILVTCLPLYYFNDGTYLYSYGPATNVLYIMGIFFIGFDFYCLLKNFKSVRAKKYYPLFILIILMILVVVLRQINPGLIIINSVFAFVTVLMYFTIENPDIQMVEELLVNREIVEKTMEDKSNLLFKITAEVKKPAHDILEKANEYKILTKKAEKEYIVEEIEQNAKDLLFVVNDILDVSSLTSSNIKMIDNLYFPHNLLLGLKIKQLKDMPENVKLDFSIASTIPEKLYGDSIKLKQIINSLICNAKQFTKEGLIEVDVSTIIKYDICRLIINVSDTGTGMSIKEINSILESQDKLTKEEKKSINENDVSLKAIVKIVRLLNGSINIKSTENKGTIVTVILDQMIVRDKQKQEISYDIQDFGRKRVMYIHKYTNNSVKLDKKLKDSSTNIVSVLFANQAVEMLNNKEKYNLIVVSDELPALETLKEIKTVKHINIPIIVLVGNGNEFLTKHYLKDGFDDIMLENDDNEVKRIKDKYL